MLGHSPELLKKPIKHIRRFIVLVLGGTVLLVGVAMLVLPGPAFIVIPAGLAILAVEFAWARTVLRKAKEMLRGGFGKPGNRQRTPDN